MKHVGPRIVPHGLDFDIIALRCKVPSHAAGTPSAKANLTGRSHWSECNCHAILGESERSSAKKSMVGPFGTRFLRRSPHASKPLFAIAMCKLSYIEIFPLNLRFSLSPYESDIPFGCDNKSIILAIM